MANSVALDDVTSSEPAGETSTTEPEVTTEVPTSDTPVESSDEGGQEIGAEETPETSEQAPEEPEQPKDTKPVAKEAKLNIGGKEYTPKEIEQIVEKNRFYQSDRDKAEYTVQRFVKQLNAQGMGVDSNLNIIPLGEPAPNKRDLVQAAAQGDPEAMQMLLDTQAKEVEERIQTKIGQVEGKRQVLREIRERYPEMYNEDGTPNMDNPLSQEASKIIAKYPHLGSFENLPIVAEIAEARLIRGNVKGIEQKIIDKTHQKMNKVAAGQALKPATKTEKAVSPLSEGERAAALKLGRDPDRVAKLVAKAQKEGGYYL